MFIPPPYTSEVFSVNYLVMSAFEETMKQTRVQRLVQMLPRLIFAYHILILNYVSIGIFYLNGKQVGIVLSIINYTVFDQRLILVTLFLETTDGTTLILPAVE